MIPLSKKHICDGTCKKFRVSKPTGSGRYRAGQGRCQICDIWLDHRGAHTKNGEPASEGSKGWYCNCCNFRIRLNPRNKKSKAKMRNSYIGDGHNIDLSYFNKRRARMLKELGQTIVKNESKDKMHNGILRLNTTRSKDMESEFGTGIDNLVELAKSVDPPNKISMITEFERIRHVLGRTPTKHDIETHSVLHLSQYEEEFGSWEHMLDRLGYDPWYRYEIPSKTIPVEDSDTHNTEMQECKEDEWYNSHSEQEIEERISKLRDWLLNYYQELDSKQTNPDYSYKGEFGRLEKHLALLPKHIKYDISTLS